jgi:hypothetical protein
MVIIPDVSSPLIATGMLKDSFTRIMAAKLSEAQAVLIIGKIAPATSMLGHIVSKDEMSAIVPQPDLCLFLYQAEILGSLDFHPVFALSNMTTGCTSPNLAMSTPILLVFSQHS